MTSEQKQSELQRHKDIVLATIDYLLSINAGSIVFDQVDYIAAYYEQQKVQIKKYYKQRRLDRLQQRLVSLTKGLQHRADVNFAGYIKEKTGYSIDIFEDLRSRIDAIVAQNEIHNQGELNDVSMMLQLYRQMAGHNEIVDELNNLVTGYLNQQHEPDAATIFRKKGDRYSEVISSVEKDGVVEITFRSLTGPKPKHFEEQVALSPDGKRRLRVTQCSNGKNASTCVTIEFPTASGAVYGANGICSDITAFWKDNSTIGITTTTDYETITQHREVRSFDDVISIEYIKK